MLALRGRHGTGGNKSFATGVDGQVQALQCSRAKKHQIARLGEYHFVNGEILVEPNDSEAHAAGHLFPVCENKAYILLLLPDTDSLQRFLRNPREFATRIDQDFLRRAERALSDGFSILHLA